MMTWHRMWSASLLVAICLISGSNATETTTQAWQDKAIQCGLSQADVMALKANRVLVTNQAHKQIFSPYLGSPCPFFITSDSLLNAYHVLYEESVFRLETARASKLPEILRLALSNLDAADDRLRGNPTLRASARRRAKLVPGVALRLLDDSFRFGDDELNAIVDLELEKIQAASGRGRPHWLGPFDASFMELDYTRYKPRGFYARTETLRRYFHAVSWLQSIPFRLDQDEELLAILMLGKSISSRRLDDYDTEREIKSFFSGYQLFLGDRDDWDIMTAASQANLALAFDLDSDALQKWRQMLKARFRKRGQGPLINDLIRFPPDDPNETAGWTYRIISACRTPSAILFQHTTDVRRFSRPYPNGLEVAISLGSAFARERLNDADKKQLLETIDACQEHFQGDSLYLQYLDVLRTLLDAPEPDAPDFMKNDAWHAKSCNTVLAGWAQLRHTWLLQTKQTVIMLCSFEGNPAGFVEPEPEFFSKMADLAANTRTLLEQSGAFEPDYIAARESLMKLKGLIATAKSADELSDAFMELTQNESGSVELAWRLVFKVMPQTNDYSGVLYRQGTRCINGLLEDIDQGQLSKKPELIAVILEHDFDLDPLWRRIETVSRRLESIARKQLRGIDLNSTETQFIESYGETLAGIMFYGGNSYMTPKDDAPRIADVYFNPECNGHLHAGIARPRQLYVLYPWHDRVILCEGVIMPYYEFTASERLTDQSWKQMLDSPQRPAVPDWTQSIIQNGNLSVPKFKR